MFAFPPQTARCSRTINWGGGGGGGEVGLGGGGLGGGVVVGLTSGGQNVERSAAVISAGAAENL